MENVLKMEFSAVAENEAFARSAAAAFIMPLDPTVEELTEIKTAISEAVSNCVIHSGSSSITMECALDKKGRISIRIEDRGIGIDNVKKAMQPLFTTGNEEERSGMGFTVMESFMDKLRVMSEPGKGTTVIMTKQLDVLSGI